MSIAKDEAESKYGDTETWMNRGPERDAYIAGRTAEPTAAEIEAAAITQFGVSCSAEGDKLIAEWEKQTDEYKCYRRVEARAVLMAARKAVTE